MSISNSSLNSFWFIFEAYLDSIGVEMLLANELLPQRAKFYSDVYPKTHMICGDITKEETRDAIVNEAIAKKVADKKAAEAAAKAEAEVTATEEEAQAEAPAEEAPAEA